MRSFQIAIVKSKYITHIVIHNVLFPFCYNLQFLNVEASAGVLLVAKKGLCRLKGNVSTNSLINLYKKGRLLIVLIELLRPLGTYLSPPIQITEVMSVSKVAFVPLNKLGDVLFHTG